MLQPFLFFNQQLKTPFLPFTHLQYLVSKKYLLCLKVDMEGFFLNGIFIPSFRFQDLFLSEVLQ